MRRQFLQLGAYTVAAGSLTAGCALNTSHIMEQTVHRPWPLPKTRWVLFMRWHDLLFLHWPVRPELVRPLIPNILELETFDGWCWIGVVPFRMSGVRPRYMPIPMAFPELNVRTYVNTAGKSGVWFFSLDATSWLAVRAARWFGLPYYDARMTVELQGEAVDYTSSRTHSEAPPGEFIASYKPTGPIYQARPGSLDHWLTERYCLYGALEPGKVVFGEIHHPQWPLQPAEAELRKNTMTQALGIELPDSKPICHFARYQEVVAWPIVPLERTK
jgi:uncharacterized protein YqjF (DUF2071 family)